MNHRNFLATDEYYHVFNKSIAGFRIFNEPQEFGRMLCSIRYYQRKKIRIDLSDFVRLKQIDAIGFDRSMNSLPGENLKLVEIIAFCLMPTHIHLVVKQLCDNGISKFMNNTLNSYTRYFNTKYKRKGPLWVGRFKRVLVETDTQLLHLTRYVHLNPTTANLVRKPQQWAYSSYKEYLGKGKGEGRISVPRGAIDISPRDYKKFVEDRRSYQKDLGIIKSFLLD
jgi:putative transposase